MPFVKIWIHAVWSTKNREPLLTNNIRKLVFQHMFANARSKDIYVDQINGYVDHCHCLLSLGVEQNVSKLMQLIKGESSFWINKEQLTTRHFQWQDDYFAVSVSESMVENVRRYIRKQEVHHQKMTFQEEYEQFMLKYGFEK